MTISKTFTTKEVARLCCVSDATVKRWEDAGLIKSERTNGGHRRFRAEEIARFQREQCIGQNFSHGGDSVFTAPKRCTESKFSSNLSLFDALISGREELTADILINAHLNGKRLNEIFDEIICPPLQKIGALWFAGDLSIAHEHLATRTLQNAIYKFRSCLPIPEPTGKLAFCCAIEGDFHEMPTHLTQILLESAGWEVMNFGANMPLFSLKDEIVKRSPDLICISAVLINDIERLSRDFIGFREQAVKQKTAVILGGKIFETECVRKRFPAELYAQSFEEFAEFVR